MTATTDTATDINPVGMVVDGPDGNARPVADLAEELLAYLSVAAGLAALPATVVDVWVDDLSEPIEILASLGHPTEAEWLTWLVHQPLNTYTVIVDHAANTLNPPPKPNPAPADRNTRDAGLEGGDGEEVEWVYESLVDWMDGYFFTVFHTDGDTTQRWCPQWWAHPEAVERLNACWRAWEDLRSAPGGGWSTWWTHHLDPHLTAITRADTGVFARCTHGHSAYTTRYTVDPPPDDLALPTLEDHQP